MRPQNSLAWEHVEQVPSAGKVPRYKCKHCKTEFTVGSVSRVLDHLLGLGKGVKPCKHLPTASVAALRSSTSQTRERSPEPLDGSSEPKRARLAQPKITDAIEASRITAVRSSVARFFFAEGIALNKVASPFFGDMCKTLMELGRDFPGAPSMKVLPTRQALGSTILDSQLAEANGKFLEIFAHDSSDYGFTFASDGFKDTRRRDIVNMTVTTSRSSAFIDALDASDETKTSVFIKDLAVTSLRGLPGGIENCIVFTTDSASNCKGAGKLVVAAHPHITWIPCTAHQVDLFLESLGELPYFAQAIQCGRAIIIFIRSHSKAESLFRSHTSLVLVQHNDTRFATNHIAMDRLLEVRTPLRQTVASPEWEAYLASPGAAKYRDLGRKIAAGILDDTFWTTLELLKEIADPAIALMRVADSAAPGSICKIYKRASEVDIAVRSNPRIHEPLKQQVVALFNERWAVLHSDMHAAAYLLDPEFFLNDKGLSATMKDLGHELTSGLLKTLRRIFANDPAKDAKVADAFAQYIGILEGDLHFGDLSAAETRTMAEKYARAHRFWKYHGGSGEMNELQYAAMRITAQISSSSVTERVWSDYDYIHCKRRNRLTAVRAKKLVRMYGHLRLESAHSRDAAASTAIPWRWQAVDDEDDDGGDASVDDDDDDE